MAAPPVCNKASSARSCSRLTSVVTILISSNVESVTSEIQQKDAWQDAAHQVKQNAAARAPASQRCETKVKEGAQPPAHAVPRVELSTYHSQKNVAAVMGPSK